MVLLRLNPESVARSRFALSPLAETLAAVITLVREDDYPWLEPWVQAHRPQFQRMMAADRFADGFLSLAASTKWIPAPLAIPPNGGMRTSIVDELARVRSFSDTAVVHELQQAHQLSWKEHDLDWVGGHDLADRIADLIHTIWTEYVEPDWPRRRAVLERDVMYRAGLLAAYGWPAAVDRMTRHRRLDRHRCDPILLADLPRSARRRRWAPVRTRHPRLGYLARRMAIRRLRHHLSSPRYRRPAATTRAASR